jgi:hypothetical protein
MKVLSLIKSLDKKQPQSIEDLRTLALQKIGEKTIKKFAHFSWINQNTDFDMYPIAIQQRCAYLPASVRGDFMTVFLFGANYGGIVGKICNDAWGGKDKEAWNMIKGLLLCEKQYPSFDEDENFAPDWDIDEDNC